MKRNTFICGVVHLFMGRRAFPSFLASLALLFAVAAYGFPDKHKGTIAVGGSPVAIGVSPDDRWVFVASSGTGMVYMLDTLTWTQVATEPLSFSTQPVELDVSMDGSNLYVTDSDGHLNQIDLAELTTTYYVGATLADANFASQQCVVEDLSGQAVGAGAVAVGPMSGYGESDVTQYVLVGATSATGVVAYQQTDISANQCNEIAFIPTSGFPAGIAVGPDSSGGGAYLAHAAIDNGGGNDEHGVISLNASFPLNPLTTLDAADHVMGDAAVNAAGDRVFMGASDTGERLFYLVESPSDTWTPASTLLSAVPKDVSIAVAKTDPGQANAAEMVFVAENDLTTDETELAFYDADTLVSAGSITLSGYNASDAAASSPDDGYVYLSDTKTGAVLVITENPWLSNLTYSPSPNDGNASTTVSFDVDVGGTLSVYLGGDIKRSGGQLMLTTPVNPGSAAFNITPAQLNEGDNTVLLFVDDGAGNVGRIGFNLVKDTAPAAPDFDANFGNQSLIVAVFTLADADINSYVIYYSDDYAKLNSDPPTGLSVSLYNFNPSGRVETTISGLSNGVTYYVRVRAIDNAGNLGALSPIKSALVQSTQTLSGLKGESGSKCSFSPSGDASFPDMTYIVLLLAAGLFARCISSARRRRCR